MAGHGGPDGDLRGLLVPDLADKDDIRILAQDGSEGTGKGQPRIWIDLGLVDPLDVGLNRVFYGDEVDRRGLDGIQQGIEGRGLSASRRAGHEDEALVALGE